MNGSELIEELKKIAVKNGYKRGVTDSTLISILSRMTHDELLVLITS